MNTSTIFNFTSFSDNIINGSIMILLQIRTISQKQNRINVKNNQRTRYLSSGDAPKLNVSSSSATSSVKGVFKRTRTLQGQ